MTTEDCITEKNITIMNNLTCSSGMYTGEFRNNSAQGEGTWTSDDGFHYEGSWYNDSFDGYGVLTCSNGAVYTGTWKNNKREGFGEYKDPDGHVYVGRWWIDTCQHRGKMTYPDGSVYDGQWSQNTPFGKGTLFKPDGTVQHCGTWTRTWNGSWDDLNISTFSTNKRKVYPDGSVYEGEFNIETEHNGTTHTTREGNGVMTYPDGSVYDGEWICDHQNGKGKMTYPDGSIYQGEWSGDIKYGVGKMINPDGSIYHEGVWTKDKIDQYYYIGKLRREDPYGKTCNFEGHTWNEHIIWYGTITYHDGVVFEGWIDPTFLDNMSEKEKDREGKVIYLDGSVYEGEWTAACQIRNSKQAKMTYPDGSVYEGGILTNQKKILIN